MRTWSDQVGALPAFDAWRLTRTQAPLALVLVHHVAASHAQGRAETTLSCVAPLDGLRLLQTDPRREGRRQLELVAGGGRLPSAGDHLGQHLLPLEKQVDLRVAGQRGMGDSEASLVDLVAAARRAAREGAAVRGGESVVPASFRRRDGLREGRPVRPQRDQRGKERNAGERDLSLRQRQVHGTGEDSSSSPNDSRTTLSKSAGSVPSGFAKSRRCMRTRACSSACSGFTDRFRRTRRSSSQTFHSRGAPVNCAGRLMTTGSGSGAGGGGGGGSTARMGSRGFGGSTRGGGGAGGSAA